MKVLMVCLGNICRSPMAQGILEKKVAESNLNVLVDSAGTSNYHIDEEPDRRSIAKCGQYGIDIQHYRGRQFQKEDFSLFDRIFAMDTSNYHNIIALAESEEQKSKVELILDLIDSNYQASVPDPYYGGEDGFELVYQQLDEACDVLIEQLKGENK